MCKHLDIVLQILTDLLLPRLFNSAYGPHKHLYDMLNIKWVALVDLHEHVLFAVLAPQLDLRLRYQHKWERYLVQY